MPPNRLRFRGTAPESIHHPRERRTLTYRRLSGLRFDDYSFRSSLFTLFTCLLESIRPTRRLSTGNRWNSSCIQAETNATRANVLT